MNVEARPSAMPSSRYDSSHQDKGKQPQGKYGSNPFRPFNFKRPYDNVFGGKGFGSDDGAPRPFGSSNPYGRPFVPYGTNFQSNNNTQQQQPQATQQRQLPDGRQQLQITSGRENANTSTGYNQNRQQSNAGNRNPFQPYNNNQQNQRRPFTRAYQHATEDQENQHPNEQAEYEAYEDAYYQNANWPEPQNERNEEPKDPDTEHDQEFGNTVESNFVTAATTQKFKCRPRHKTFKSNNSLHRHIRDSISKSQVLTNPPFLAW